MSATSISRVQDVKNVKRDVLWECRSYLSHGDDDEHSATTRLRDDGQKFGVDWAVDAVVGVGRNFDVIVTLFPLLGFPVDVPEFGLTDYLRHGSVLCRWKVISCVRSTCKARGEEFRGVCALIGGSSFCASAARCWREKKKNKHKTPRLQARFPVTEKRSINKQRKGRESKNVGSMTFLKTVAYCRERHRKGHT